MNLKDFKQYQEYAHKRLRGTITREELEKLEYWMKDVDDEPIIINESDSYTHQNKILQKIHKKTQRHTHIQYVKYWGRWAAIFLLVLTTVVFYSKRKSREPLNEDSNLVSATSLIPGDNKAVLTLSNGQQIILGNSNDTSTIAHEGKVQVMQNQSGEIVYVTKQSNKSELPLKNTLVTPIGGRFKLMLTDGTRVWLNAQSKIVYPSQFPDDHREVEISGEAYLEVAHDSRRPFSVKVNGVNISVLGTRFNVNSYADNDYLEVTLAEGSIRASNKKNTVLLYPREQMQLYNLGEMHIKKNVDVDKILAWKDERFNFGTGTDIREVMKQLSRWYGFSEIIFEEGLKAEVGGEISRNVDGWKVLEMLEKTGTVKFSINNKTIKVMSP